MSEHIKSPEELAEDFVFVTWVNKGVPEPQHYDYKDMEAAYLAGRASLEADLAQARAEVAELREALEFYANGAEPYKVTEGNKTYWLKEFGCGCCATNYDDDDGEPGVGEYTMEDVPGTRARAALDSAAKRRAGREEG